MFDPANKTLMLKYRLAEKVKELPRSFSIEDLLKLLSKHKISRDAFYRDRGILLKSSQSISSDRLDAYAVVFGCTPNDLKNYEVKGKSIQEILNGKKKVKTGLR